MRRKTTHRKTPADSRIGLAIAACAILGFAPGVHAAKPSRGMTVAMEEPSTVPPGAGWSAISTSLSDGGRAVAPAIQTASAAPAVSASSDGWQSLGGASFSAAAVPDAAKPVASKPAATAPEKTSLESAANSASPVLAPAPTAPVSSSVVDAPSISPFALVAGQSMQSQLTAWGKRVGWVVSWNTPDDWIVPNDGAYGSDFQAAVTQVVDDARGNGADLQADIWQGNRTVVIDKTGAMQ